MIYCRLLLFFLWSKYRTFEFLSQYFDRLVASSSTIPEGWVISIWLEGSIFSSWHMYNLSHGIVGNKYFWVRRFFRNIYRTYRRGKYWRNSERKKYIHVAYIRQVGIRIKLKNSAWIVYPKLLHRIITCIFILLVKILLKLKYIFFNIIFTFFRLFQNIFESIRNVRSSDP